MSDATGAGAAHGVPVDPAALIRSRQYRALLVIAALVGVLVSLASWGFLELVHWVQVLVYEDLPDLLGFDAMPWWWPLPVLATAGLLTAWAIHRLPGTAGHIPYQGIKAGRTSPVELPGILLAALASLGLGLVLGPEGPLIAGGTGLAVWAVRLAKKDLPEQAMAVLAAAAAFAAIATIFGSPVVGAVILIEAAGLGGPTLPLVLLPGLMSAGIGSLVFTGLGEWTGLSSSDYALTPFALPALTQLTFAQFAWAIVLSVAAAVVCSAIVEGARLSDARVGRRPWVLLPVAGAVVGGLAILFGLLTDQPSVTVLFSGQEAFSELFAQAPTLSVATLLWLLALKGAAWSLSMGSFRGGPTFPALFLGAVGGILAGSLPGMSETAAVAVLMGAMAVSILRLPLSAVVLAVALSASGGPQTAPLIIVGVVVAYLTTLALDAARGNRPQAGAAGAAGAGDAGRSGS